MSTATATKPEFGLAPILEIPIHKLVPSPENDRLYRPIDLDDPDFIAFANGIAEIGIKELLVVTADYFVVSGHRRLAAAKLVGLAHVRCEVLDFHKDDDHDRFILLLREHNRQRVKTFGETLREQAIDADPEIAYQALIEHRQETSAVEIHTFNIEGSVKRANISPAKKPLLAAIQRVIADLQDFWPLSDRLIHYNLLNNPPLKHASKPDSVYCNDAEGKSYKALTELLTRARVAGIIPMEVIADPTRPVVTWNIHQDVSSYLQEQTEGVGRGYWRDLMQSQPNHIEIVGEKNTIKGTIQSVAMKYRLPMTIGRGYCSLRPRYDLVQRFRKSGKNRLILLIVSDFDPAGEEIAHSFARSIRDDFGVEEIEPVKVALTHDHVNQLSLPAGGKAKKKDSKAKKFIDKYGDDVWELEALAPTALQEILSGVIDSVIDIEAFNHETDREKEDAAKLEGVREIVIDVLRQYEE